MIQQRKCKKKEKKKQCHISDESPLVGKHSDQRVFICTFIAMYVFIGHVCWKWKRDEDRKSCSCRWAAPFFGGNEDWSDGCQRSLQEILTLKKSLRSNLTIAKVSDMFLTYRFKKNAPRVFLNVFTVISEGENRCFWWRIRISSPSLQKEWIFHRLPLSITLKRRRSSHSDTVNLQRHNNPEWTSLY